MEPIIGIDLGTTNSEVACIIGSNSQVIENGDRGILPSCVGLDPDGKIIVGAEAKNQAVIAPDKTVLSIKRLMGSDEKIVLGDTAYLPQEISAFILKALKARAEKSMERPVEKAIITVPAYFTDAQRQATREAGAIAGLEVVRIINEPTAAALAYENTNSETRRILVYDLGGGTFDVSIVKIENKIVEVLASTGDNKLGGDDFDRKIMETLADHCENKLKIKVKNNPVIMARLRKAAEDAKITLSSEPYAKIEEDHIGKKLMKAVHLSYELSRIDFEEMIEEDVSKTNDAISKALKDASLLPSDIDKIILVGGSTRVPKIPKMLEERFKKKPHGEIDPDLCVAIGAAMQAGREMGMDNSGVLLDVTPYTFGTSAIGEVNGIPTATMFVPIIHRNTKLPASKSDAFHTIVDNQERVEIRIFQGEKPEALDNIEIGKYMFDLTEAPAGSVIVMNFDLDINGILKIRAVEKISDKHVEATIENAFSAFDEKEMEASRGKIDSVWAGEDESFITTGTGFKPETGKSETDTPEPPPDGIPAETAAVMDKAAGLLDTVDEEEKDEIINLMEDIRDAAKEKRFEDIEKLREAVFNLNTVRTVAVIEEITGQYASVGKALKRLASEYKYDRLLELLDDDDNGHKL